MSRAPPSLFPVDVAMARVLLLSLLLPHTLGADALGSQSNPLVVHELQAVPRSGRRRSESQRQLRGKTLSAKSPELKPLYPGYGTHFVYAYVGSPVQRQSLIVDTASSYTAFPCVGCLLCGDHTDPYFDVTASTTKQIPQCAADVCHISMAYTEGSSWDAVAVVDTFSFGGILETSVTTAYAVKHYFACQTAVSGVFKTQLADGILGLSMAPTAVHYQMHDQGVSESKVFALCFKTGGGIMTVGGVDSSIHMSSTVNYAPLQPSSSGFYQVKISDIVLVPPGFGASPKSLNLSPDVLSQRSFAIVDSGTTDTFLPKSLLGDFSTNFKAITGIDYTTEDVALTDAQLNSIPAVKFLIPDTNGGTFFVTMPMESYVEDVSESESERVFAFRLYFTEDEGAILGSNFMLGELLQLLIGGT